MPSDRRIDKPTPNGGAYSIAYFLDEDGKAIDEKKATRVEIVEFSKEGEQIARTYGSMKPKTKG